MVPNSRELTRCCAGVDASARFALSQRRSLPLARGQYLEGARGRECSKDSFALCAGPRLVFSPFASVVVCLYFARPPAIRLPCPSQSRYCANERRSQLVIHQARTRANCASVARYHHDHESPLLFDIRHRFDNTSVFDYFQSPHTRSPQSRLINSTTPNKPSTWPTVSHREAPSGAYAPPCW